MRMPPNPEFLILEIIFTIIALVLGILIYFKTKESYELTKHHGIKYFRDAFLFLGLSYLLRFLFSLVFLSRIMINDTMSRKVFMPIFIVLLGYFGTISLWYLIVSSTWKKLGNDKKYILFGHIFAIIVSIVSFITHSPEFMLYIHLALILLYFIIISTFRDKNKSLNKKIFSRTKVLYFLVALLWSINLLTAGRPIFPRVAGILFQALAIMLFAIIYYKVSKRIK
ncbi:MAG: hypothetical protein ACP5N1_06790 [Candidatus Woesearchaeota archaeon]